MPRYMLDTDTCSYIMKRSNDAVLKRLQRVPVSDVCISVITKSELLFGVEVSPRRQQDDSALSAFLRYVDVLDFPDAASLHYANIRAHLKTSGTMIGANDLFLLQDSCAAAANVTACLQAGLPGVLGTVQANLVTIYSGLRAAGYRGTFVAVTYYSTNYTNPALTGAVQALDGVLATVTRSYGGKVASGFAAFAAASAFRGGDPCAAGLLIHLTSSTCDEHPSRAGAELLALALYSAVDPWWPNTKPRT